jgi:hypothetical protein
MNKVCPQTVGRCLDNFRSRWIAALQLLCVLFWTIQPVQRLHTYESQENWISWSGYWYIDGMEQWIQGAYPDWQTWQDLDGDNLPDWADPYPSDYSNNTFWSMSGSWYVDFMDQWFESSPYATTTPQDLNSNGLPDWYDIHYPTHGSSTPWSTPGGYWTAQGVEDWMVWGIYPSHPWQDSDSDGLPDDIDPYPWDDSNGSFVLNYWGGQWWIDGVEQWLGGAESTWIDSDNDGIPDSYDAYPFDATNNSTFWAGNSYWIDGEERWYESQYFATSTYQDSDGDGLPNAIDPYPYNTSNVYVEPTAWSGWYWISGIERHLSGIYTEWHDTDQDGIPNSVDPYPNDRHNGTDWFELFDTQSPDSDEDGLPDSVENYYGLNRDSSADANADLDNDGLPNLWEYQNYFNLKDPFTSIEDPDFDTLTNLEEYLHDTDPWRADSDGDGFDDGEEIAAGSHPRRAESTPFNLGGHGTGSSIIDSDGDGISDWEEEQSNTDPNNPDSDGDGFSDSYELQQGTDPRDPTAVPQPLITLQVRKKSITASGIAPNIVNGDPFHPDSIVTGYAGIQWSTSVQGGSWFGPVTYSYQESGPDLRANMNDPAYEHLWTPGAPRAYGAGDMPGTMSQLDWGEQEEGWQNVETAEATFDGDDQLSSASYLQYRLAVIYPIGYPQEKMQSGLSKTVLAVAQIYNAQQNRWDLDQASGGEAVKSETLVADQVSGTSSQEGVTYTSTIKTLEPTGTAGQKKKDSVLPVELLTDLNNDGKIDSADSALVVKPYLPELDNSSGTNSAIELERDKGTEFLFTNDDLSNGAWEKADTLTDGKPGEIVDDDDAEELKIKFGLDAGDLWMEHPAIDSLSFYKTKECKTTDKINIKESAKFALSSSNRLPDNLFVRADGPISFETTNIQKDGDLVLKYQPPGGQAVEATKMKFTVVSGVGALKYFQAARDYIFERNTNLHVRERGYPLNNPQTVFRICTMREEATTLTPIETAQRSFVDSAQLCGIERVAARWEDLTVLINGNQVFFSSGLGKWGAGFQSIFGPLKPMTDKCHGRIIPNGTVNPASSDETNTALTPPGSSLAGTLGRWIAKNDQSKWTFGAGVVPDNCSLPQALGGLSTNYSGNPKRNGEPTQNVGYASLGADGKGCIFTATVTHGYGRLGDFAADARYSGVDTLPGGGTFDLCLLVLDSGDTSVGLMHGNPAGAMKLIDKGTKHDGIPYFVKTYLGFTAQKPR